MPSSSLLPVAADDCSTGPKNPKFHPTMGGVCGTGDAAGDAQQQQQQQQQLLDFIGSASAVKDLFTLPYVLDRPVSVAVHNLGGTLLIDTDPGHAVLEPQLEAFAKKKRRRARPLPSSTVASALVASSTSITGAKGNQKDDSVEHNNNSSINSNSNTIVTQSLVALSSLEDSASSSEALSLVNTILQQEFALHRQKQKQRQAAVSPADECAERYIPRIPEPREYLSWKFRDLNLLVGSDALIYRAARDSSNKSNNSNDDNDDATTENNTAALAVRVEDVRRMQALLQQHQETVRTGAFVPDHRHPPLQQQGKPSYAQAAASQTKTQSMVKNNGAEPVTPGFDETDATDYSTKSRMSNIGFAAPNLDLVQLQTCIVPYANEPFVGSSNSLFQTAHSVSQRDKSASASSPVSTVLDTYLDTIMANVPQLALCLEEKGFIQSVKLLQAEAIPSQFLHRETLDTSQPLEYISNNAANEDIFSPQVMETNALALLRFLKTNCSRDNATYLFRRDNSGNNVQLYDISSISAQRQEKWIWWLALISYRFAHRLRHLQQHNFPLSAAVQRNFRFRQRSLLQNTIDLLETLADRNDHRAHESLRAAVRENLADTFLVETRKSACTSEGGSNIASSSSSPLDPPPSPLKSSPPSSSELPSSTTGRAVASQHQPYAHCSSVDSLGKAQDHLRLGILILNPVLEGRLAWMQKKHPGTVTAAVTAVSPTATSPVETLSVETCESSDSEDEDDDDESSSVRSDNDTEDDMEPVVTQLVGLHRKMIDVSLRLSEIHLQNYYSSSAMQNLRTAAHHIARSLALARLVADSCEHWLRQLQLQCTWLWEHCGYFARSFAADELWRDRGHASGDDVVSVLRDVEAALARQDGGEVVDETKKQREGVRFDYDFFCASLCSPSSIAVNETVEKSKTSRTSGVTLSFDCLSGIVDFQSENVQSDISMTTATRKAGIEVAKHRLSEQKTLQRDKRNVLVAASVAYHRASQLFGAYCMWQYQTGQSSPEPPLVELLQQRLGDACNETGKVLLNELRSWLVSLPTLTKLSDESVVVGTDILCGSAEFWFLEGLHSFQACRDFRNLALMRCNLCQLYKLRANAIFDTAPKLSSAESGNVPGHADDCLRQATHHLQAAHEALGVRDFDPYSWDMVSTELAATLLVLGVRRRQALLGSSSSTVTNDADPVQLWKAVTTRLSPGSERSIVDPLTRALDIYKQMENKHQAAATHYQLAQFYCKIWTCQRDEAKTREKLAAAFQHYNAAFAYFAQASRGNEATFCLLCLDIASLYSTVSGHDFIEKALVRCLDTVACFGVESILAAASSKDLAKRQDWFETLDTLASSVEDRIFKLLKSLVRLEESKTGEAAIGGIKIFKDLYRTGLTQKITAGHNTTFPATTLGDERLDAIAGHLTCVFELLRAIASKYQSAITIASPQSKT